MTRTRSDTARFDAPLWRGFACTGVLLIAAQLVLAWHAQRMLMVTGLAVFVLAGLAAAWVPSRLPSLLRLLLVLAALLNAAGGFFRWFDNVPWFDELAHGYTGFAGLAAIGFLYARVDVLRRDSLVGWCAAMGLALGVGWEVLEGMAGPLGLVDTLSDLVMDVLGAALGGAFARHVLQAVAPDGA
ncbi:hypothetical protein [Ramlibacter rhizophilus]|uniref:VanZ family protein n=1 Tax=Ramlibacter rhizophilus TaxID=1781167 RepID=A0A4Z0BGL5_9BURK|nr:hypothetical protein [Ramlibacter rhizophilus]TFY98455.1 hypothetical protein EZ242_12980 [Ramlibacter rhizophilus]